MGGGTGTGRRNSGCAQGHLGRGVSVHWPDCGDGFAAVYIRQLCPCYKCGVDCRLSLSKAVRKNTF